MGIRISGIGAYVPAKTVTNHELAGRLDTSHEWIVARTGIVSIASSRERDSVEERP